MVLLAEANLEITKIMYLTLAKICVLGDVPRSIDKLQFCLNIYKTSFLAD